VTGRALLLVTIAACGPARAPEPTPQDGTGTKAALVVVAPDVATLDRTIDVLAPVGGDHFAAFRFGTVAPWPASELAARGVRADAPIGGAITADGVVVRWAGVADATKLGAALDREPGAQRWDAEGTALWRLGDDALAVVGKERTAVVAGGAATVRERTALAIASGALDASAPLHAGGLAIEIDGTFLVARLVPEPGPIATKLGTDVGRIRVGLTAAPEVVGVDVDVHPAAGTLAAEMIAGASGAKMMTPDTRISFATRIAPERAVELLTELGQPYEIDVGEVVQAIGRGPALLAGDIAFGPGAVSVRLADVDTMEVVSRMFAPIVYDRDYGLGSMTVGDHGSYGPNAGVVLRPARFGAPPAIADPPEKPPAIDDDNGDVPWSLEYKQARKAYEAAVAKLATAITYRTTAINAAWNQWTQAFGYAVAIQLVPSGGGYQGHGEWHPAKGTIAASVAAASAEFNDLRHHDNDVAAAHAAALAARQHALEIRARDVQAWDNQKR
jgi:hypothetical protein